jgi:hypothetical protein
MGGLKQELNTKKHHVLECKFVKNGAKNMNRLLILNLLIQTKRKLTNSRVIF